MTAAAPVYENPRDLDEMTEEEIAADAELQEAIAAECGEVDAPIVEPATALARTEPAALAPADFELLDDFQTLEVTTLYVLRWIGERDDTGRRPRLYYCSGPALEGWDPRPTAALRFTMEDVAAGTLERLRRVGQAPDVCMMGGTSAVVPRKVRVMERRS